ncbi:MAG: hypothetical protein ACXIU7_12990 [Roseinatronobacter sp.]
MKFLIPLIMIILGGAIGAGAGYFMRAEETPEASEQTPPPPRTNVELTLLELPNQFVVPLIVDDRIDAMMVLRLAIEFDATHADVIDAHMLHLREVFLQQLFDHANNGGFSGTFTHQATLNRLRSSLRDATERITGVQGITRVLITDIARRSP